MSCFPCYPFQVLPHNATVKCLISRNSDILLGTSTMLRLLNPRTFERLTVAGLIISCVLNFLALPLAIRSTRHILGTYKIIMLLFSTTNTLFYIPLLLRPVHYFRRYMIVVYVDGSDDWIKDIATDLSIKFFAVIFMITIFLEALHFVYRYLLLCQLTL